MDNANEMTIVNKLIDDESKYIYDMLKKYSITSNYQELIHDIYMMNYTWDVDSYDLLDIKENSVGKKIVVFGASYEGDITVDILEKNGFSVFAFCDNNILIQNTRRNNKQVMSLKDIIDNQNNYYVVISSFCWKFKMYDQLMQSRFPRKNIHYPRIGKIFATNGNQYFDCEYIKPLGDKEVFVDCGCFDMATSINFIEWCGGKYKKIYAFEPDKYNFNKCACIAKNIDNVELLPFATWSEYTTIDFSNAAQGARISEGKADDIVNCVSIDDVLEGNIVTYIKMDVEGSEIPSIQGCANTIRKYKPRLAICIYHNKNDVIDIPEIIMNLRDDYKFAMRHYTNYHYESVLYAF